MAKFGIKKSIVKLGALAITAAAIFGAGVGPAYAQNAGLRVYVNGQAITETSNPALFNIQSLLPGDTVPGTVRIVNNDANFANAGVQSATTGSNTLADHVYITISGTGMTAYNQKISKFFADSASSLFLSRIDGNSEATYNFAINYPETEIEEQDATVGFDLNFGNLNPGTNTLTVIGGQPTMGGESSGQFIFEIRNVIGRRLADDNGDIKWETTKPANGRIIYSSQNEPHLFKYSDKPLYGYSHIYPVMADSVYDSTHNFTVPNLDPCLNYYFRVVSAENGGQPSVSKDEYIISRAVDCANANNSNFGQPIVLASAGGNERAAAGDVMGAETERLDENGNVIDGTGQGKDEDGKTVNGNKCQPDFPWWVFLIFTALCLFHGWKHKKTRNYWLAGGVVSLLIVIWAFFAQMYCVSWKLFLVMLAVIGAAWIFDRNRK
jgi:hypothetical protein